MSRPASSYLPYVRDGRHRGLLVERPEGEATRRSFAELTGSTSTSRSRWPPAWHGGVQTDLPSVLLCGAGARHGGVSGIPGHNASRAVLAMR